jgi:hypothetical protein
MSKSDKGFLQVTFGITMVKIRKMVVLHVLGLCDAHRRRQV